MARMDMFLIVALANLYSDVDFRVPGDDRYYTHEPIGETRKLLGVDWLREGYKDNYLPFVKAIVTDHEIRNSRHLMAYNIGNELKAESRGQTNNLASLSYSSRSCTRWPARSESGMAATT